MNNICFVFRNSAFSVRSSDYEGIISSFLSGGYRMDEICLIDFSGRDKAVERVKQGCYDCAVFVCERVYIPYLSSLFGQSQMESCALDFVDAKIFLIEKGKAGEHFTQNTAISALNERFNNRFERMVVRAVGVPEKTLSDTLSRADLLYEELSKDYQNLLLKPINCEESFEDYKIELIYDKNSPKMLVDRVFREIVLGLEPYIYSLEDRTLAERLYDVLTVRKMKICVAESFTGGGISKKLVEVSGISSVYLEGFTTYSNESKAMRLGVKEFSLGTFGAVSDQVAYEMALGLLKNNPSCDISIATTGIAGPKSDNTQKPVGLCYVSVGTKEGIFVHKYNLKGTREEITNTAINFALFLAIKKLL